ncbi:DUF2817 domain-containing protein [Bacteriovorax sp. Seq25_V]|uniref:DUF2817 domain-containing protein n=1 Tax=Bacteriovorax sp. Seq25_V TaxID=1201288 RepID=UPI000389F44C|nr:DUF2817 domain-containing protein [Bacteriovorax sp. Seq25_V]EQC47966.1 zinc carboxypeptidase [Bacteriovorax sp. Seq25_V]
MKLVLFFISSILLTSCATNSQNRSISSIEDSSCTELFKTYLHATSPFNYQINLDRVFKEIEALESKFPNQLTTKIEGQYDGEPIYRIDMPGYGTGDKKKIIITSGVHGNESVGVSTLLKVINQIVYDKNMRTKFDFVFFPALNPGGLRQNTRRLKNDVDLNRTFTKGKEQGVTKILQESLDGEEFELALDLHEAYTKNGFFVIKADKEDDQLTKESLSIIDESYMLTSKDGQYPYNVPNVKDPRKTSYILYSPGETASFNPGTLKGFFKTNLKAKYAYTIESPGQIELRKRQEIYINIVRSFLDNYSKRD